MEEASPRAVANDSNRKTADEERDRALLARLAAHDRAALTEFYDRFAQPLYSYLIRLTGDSALAEDAVQEVMIAIWRAAGTYRGDSRVSSWVFGIAHNQAIKSMRRHPGGPSTPVPIDVASELADDASSPELRAIRKATAEAVAVGLACLTPEHREVLELAFYHDLSCKEIAAIAAVSEGTVKSRLWYARRALKAELLRRGWELS